MTKGRTVIIFADIRNSTEFAASQTSEQYNNVLRAFHNLAREVITDYQRRPDIHNTKILAGAVGDECHIFLWNGAKDRDECHALQLAVRLKMAWRTSRYARQLDFLGISGFGAQLDLRIGIGSGDDVIYDTDTWTNTNTPESFYISQTKRIESIAEELAPATLILVKSDIKDACDRQRLRIKFGNAIRNPKLKGIRRGNTEITLFPVLSWQEFIRVQKDIKPTFMNPFDLCSLGYAQHMSGNFKAAIKSYHRANLLFKRQFNQEYAAALNNMGAIQMGLEDYSAAITCYLQALIDNDNDPVLWFNLGLCYQKVDQQDHAVEAFKQALTNNNDYVEALNQLAICYMQGLRYDQAKELLEHAMRIQPQFSDTLYNLSCLEIRSGNITAALIYLRLAFSFNPQAYISHVQSDPDFDDLRDNKDFIVITTG